MKICLSEGRIGRNRRLGSWIQLALGKTLSGMFVSLRDGLAFTSVPAEDLELSKTLNYISIVMFFFREHCNW
jgi:hypothetical protein